MDTKFLNRPGWQMRCWLQRLTWPWLAAGCLLAFGAGFYFSMVEPVRNDLQDARRDLLALQDEIRLAGQSAAGSVQPAAQKNGLAEFYKFFPSERSIPDWMEKIVAAAAKNNLTLSQGDYQITRDKTGKLLGYHLALPVKGGYPSIRGFVASVLADVSIASLDNVKFERQKIGDNAVEATVLLTLHLGSES